MYCVEFWGKGKLLFRDEETQKLTSMEASRNCQGLRGEGKGKEHKTSMDIDLGCGSSLGWRLVSVIVYILGAWMFLNVASTIL